MDRGEKASGFMSKSSSKRDKPDFLALAIGDFDKVCFTLLSRRGLDALERGVKLKRGSVAGFFLTVFETKGVASGPGELVGFA